MHKEILSEYLGDIDPELLLQNLTNINPAINTIDELRLGLSQLKGKLQVSADYEFQWVGDPNTTEPEPGSKRFVRFTIEPGDSSGGHQLVKRS